MNRAAKCNTLCKKKSVLSTKELLRCYNHRIGSNSYIKKHVIYQQQHQQLNRNKSVAKQRIPYNCKKLTNQKRAI